MKKLNESLECLSDNDIAHLPFLKMPVCTRHYFDISVNSSMVDNNL